MAPPPRELMEELVEEILLRFPPDDPESLLRAALVCKLWCRLVCGAGFRRRFRELHRRAAPVLGLLYHDHDHDTYWVRHQRKVPVPTKAYFVPTTSFRPARAAASGGLVGWGAIDARHGRVLLYWSSPPPRNGRGFSVWDPFTDEQRRLPNPPPLYMSSRSTAAVACARAAATAAGDNGNCCDCDHLDCRRGPFIVVVMDIIDYNRMHLSVYSSEDGAWSKRTVWDGPNTKSCGTFSNMPGVLVGTALCFLVHLNNKILNHKIVQYDLATRQVSRIFLPSKFRQLKRSIVLIADDDGGLGFVSGSIKDQLKLWSRVPGPAGDVDFVLSRVIDLRKVLPSGALINNSPYQLSGFVSDGASRILFIRTFDGLYSVEINSSKVNKVASYCGMGNVIPYISFCTPNSRLQQYYVPPRVRDLGLIQQLDKD